MEAINVSIDFDARLIEQDIAASKAHATMLAQQGIISQADGDAILAGLDQVLADEDLLRQELLVRHVAQVVAETGEGATCASSVLRRCANEDVHVEGRPSIAVHREGRRADQDVLDAMTV